MSVQLLDNTRMINQLLQSSSADKVIFSDICNVMSRIFAGHVLVISRKGKVLGAGRTGKGADGEWLLTGKVGTFVDAKFNERLLSILSTNDNVNLEMLGFDKEKARNYKAIVSPVFIAGERLGTLFIYTTSSGFDIDSIILSEYSATVIGMAMRQSVNEEFAEEDIKKMYYIDRNGARHDAPYWPASAVREIYDSVKAEIKPYNACDFYVTMNMVASDNWALLERWFPGMSAEDRNRRTVELAVNWLNDPDSQHAENKIWQYLHK